MSATRPDKHPDPDVEGAAESRRAIMFPKASALIGREMRAIQAEETASRIARARRVGRDLGMQDGLDLGHSIRTDIEAADWRDPADTNIRRKNPREVHGARRVDILVTMMRRKSPIELRHVAAADRYRIDYEVGIEGSHPGRDPMATSDAETPTDPEMGRLAALANFRHATQAVGKMLSGILVHVVLAGLDVSAWATWKQTKPEHAMGYLVAALDRLAEHYGISAAITAQEVDPLAPEGLKIA